MKSKAKEKEEEKRAKALEREEKRRQKELKLEREQQKKGRKQEKADVERKKKRRGNESLDDLVSNLKLSDSEESGPDSGVSDALCPTCGVLFSTDCKEDGLVAMDVGIGIMSIALISKEKGGFLNIFL